MKKKDLVSFYNYLLSLDVPRLSICDSFVQWLFLTQRVPELAALEIYEEYSAQILTIIESDINHHKAKFTYAKYQFSTYDKDLLIQTHLIQQSDFVAEVRHKIEWWKKVDDLIRILDWRTFELLAKQVLKENGVSDIKITKATNDQGIDFFGYFNLPMNSSRSRLANELQFRVVGQVKHSADGNGVDHQKIASFGTEVGKLRKTNSSSYFHNLDEAFLLSPFPVIGIFIANSYYPKKAVNFAQEYGIIFWDGVQISQDLATPELINKIKDETGHLVKDKLIDLIEHNG